MEKMNIVDKLEDLHQRVITNETTARLSRKNEELQTENDALVNAISLMEISNHGNADIVLSKQANRAVTLRELLLVIKSLAKGTDGHEADIERVRVQLTSEYEAKLAEASARENELRQQLVARAKTQSTMEAKVASLQQQLAEKEAELSEQRKTMQNEAAQRKSLAAKIAAARKENVSLGQKVSSLQQQLSVAAKQIEADKLASKQASILADKQKGSAVAAAKADGQAKIQQIESAKVAAVQKLEKAHATTRQELAELRKQLKAKDDLIVRYRQALQRAQKNRQSAQGTSSNTQEKNPAPSTISSGPAPTPASQKQQVQDSNAKKAAQKASPASKPPSKVSKKPEPKLREAAVSKKTKTAVTTASNPQAKTAVNTSSTAGKIPPKLPVRRTSVKKTTAPKGVPKKSDSTTPASQKSATGGSPLPVAVPKPSAPAAKPLSKADAKAAVLARIVAAAKKKDHSKASNTSSVQGASGTKIVSKPSAAQVMKTLKAAKRGASAATTKSSLTAPGSKVAKVSDRAKGKVATKPTKASLLILQKLKAKKTSAKTSNAAAKESKTAVSPRKRRIQAVGDAATTPRTRAKLAAKSSSEVAQAMKSDSPSV